MTLIYVVAILTTQTNIKESISMSKPQAISVLDKLFNILHLINNSDIKLSSYDVADITGYNQRTVLRYLSRLVQERLIDFGVRMETVTYDYNRKEDNQVFEAKRPSSTYEYYKLGR